MVYLVVVISLYVCMYYVVFVFFFFKQKTAYEMRISDWSSDVCSSDLVGYQIGKTLKISVPHRGKSYLHIAGGPQHTMESAIQEMLVQSRGMKSDWRLNHIHTCATEGQTIGLVVRASGFSFVNRNHYV